MREARLPPLEILSGGYDVLLILNRPSLQKRRHANDNLNEHHMPATPSGAPPPKTARKLKTHSASNQGLKRSIKPEPPPIAADIPYVSAFTIGDHVSHFQFGEGSVTEIDGAKLTINFAIRGTKQIVDYYVKLPKK
jgi:hypothetical protein